MLRVCLRTLTLGLSIAALSACEAADEGEPVELPELELEIADYRVPCEGVARQLCYRFRAVGGDWELAANGVQGLDYQWGRTYRVKVREESVADPPADGAGVVRYLESIEDERPARQAFELTLEAGDLAPAAMADYVLLGERRVQCASNEVRQAVEARRANGQAVTVMLRHGETPEAPLSLFRVVR